MTGNDDLESSLHVGRDYYSMNEKIYDMDDVNSDNFGNEKTFGDLGHNRSNLMKKNLLLFD
jgi:hypothetical protein